MSGRVKAAVFASGTGSNFEAIMNEQDLACDIVLLISDQPGAKVIEKAQRFGVDTIIVERKDFASKAAFEEAMITALKTAEVEWVFLAGYMRIIGKTLLHAYEGRIVNIHPSLLPAFPGINAIEQALNAGAKKSGVTLHFVDEGIDTGPIIVQEEVEILPDDTLLTLQQRIHAVEHKLYPKVINHLVNGGQTS